MRNNILLVTALLFLSCKENETIENKIDENKQIRINEKNMLSKLPFASKDICNYFKIDSLSKEIEITPSSLEIDKFQKEDFLIKIRENDFEINPQVGSNFYIIKTFTSSKTNCEVIMYLTNGENNSKIFNVQLNCFNQLKKISDKILLDCRLKFEDEYYREFEIAEDGMILIKKNTVSKLLFSEEGDIIGEKNVPDTISETVKYKIDNGKLLKI